MAVVFVSSEYQYRTGGNRLCVLVLIPAVLVFLAGQDYLEQGIVSTAVKE